MGRGLDECLRFSQNTADFPIENDFWRGEGDQQRGDYCGEGVNNTLSLNIFKTLFIHFEGASDVICLFFYTQLTELTTGDDQQLDIEESRQSLLDDEDFTEYKVRL